MKVIIGLGHPAHYHLFKAFIKHCIIKSIDHIVVILNKDILEDLLIKDKITYVKLINKTTSKSIASKLKEQYSSSLQFFKTANNFKPTILVGCINQIVYYGWRKKIPNIFFAEDDFKATYLQGLLLYPFTTKIVTPTCTSVYPFNWKQTKHKSYHELAYLHPNHFNPDQEIVNMYINPDSKYFIIRFAKLTAHHDVGIRGVNDQLARKLIEILKPFGKIIISSERSITPDLEPYRLAIDPRHMHHIMAYANLYIGDSQTMAAEAAVLGTPFIRFNDFVGKLGYLDELENKYKIGHGIEVDQPEKLFNTVQNLINDPASKEKAMERRNKMLAEKIDFAQFMVWFIEHYPASAKIMKENPEYQERFK